MSTEKILYSIKILSLLGISLAVYLLWQQFFRPSFQPCNINSFINCDAIVSGPVAKTLGISTPLFGLIGYVIIFLAAKFSKIKLMFAVSAFGLVFCLWIAYQELLLLRVICPVCIACQIIMIAVFVLAFKKIRRNK